MRDIGWFTGYFLLVLILLSAQQSVSSSISQFLLMKPIRAGVLSIQGARESAGEWFRNRENLLRELDELRVVKAENRRLQARIRQLTRENRQLRNQLDLASTFEYDLALAEVVQRDLGPWKNRLRVRLSPDHSVDTGSVAVVYRNRKLYLWGVVDSVYSDFARVKGVRDPEFRLGVSLAGFNDRHWVVTGSGEDLLRIDPFPAYLEVEPGTPVYASEVSSLASHQWLVGWIQERVKESKMAGNVSLTVEPASPPTAAYLWIVMNAD